MMTMILARSSDSLYLHRVMLADTSDALGSVKRSSLSQILLFSLHMLFFFP